MCTDLYIGPWLYGHLPYGSHYAPSCDLNTTLTCSHYAPSCDLNTTLTCSRYAPSCDLSTALTCSRYITELCLQNSHHVPCCVLSTALMYRQYVLTCVPKWTQPYSRKCSHRAEVAQWPSERAAINIDLCPLFVVMPKGQC